ncbi:TPA: hypothetical protein JC757_002848 [Salmonella enterica subsp. diarizonae]|nr:hypothetical protein [Salmonella enterica subsp. diarizonae]
MAYQQIIYEQLKNHLYTLYGASHEDCDALYLRNLLNFRAISLTLFHAALNQYRSREIYYASLTDYEITLHLLYEEAGEIVSDLNRIPLSLTLKILELRLQRVLRSTDAEFQTSVAGMNKYFEERTKRSLQPFANTPVLRELKWGDLPGKLFSLTPGS